MQVNILEYNSVFYKTLKYVFSVTEFTKSMLYNYIKVVRLKLDQPNQWLLTYYTWYTIVYKDIHKHNYMAYIIIWLHENT